MAKKPEPPTPVRWDIYRAAAKLRPLGTVEAADKAEANRESRGRIQGSGHQAHRSVAMTLILRKSRAQARIEACQHARWGNDDYAIVDNTTVVGRIYNEMVIGEPKWRWFVKRSRTMSFGVAITAIALPRFC
jgi:hypothetical protein